MKRIIYTMAIAVSVLMIGCKGGENKESGVTADSTAATASEINANTSGLKEYDLSDKGVKLVVKAPEGSTIEQTASGAIEIKSGNFQVQIAEGSGDMALYKNDVKNNEVNKFKRYLAEEPEGILYESMVTQPEFHYLYIIKNGETIYEIQDIKGAFFTEDEASLMYKAAKESKTK